MYGMRSFLHLYRVCIPTSLLDNLSSLTALLRALDDLDALFESIEDAYKASLMHDKIVLWDERR
jgi:DNA-directed RNA polymerase I and III subunit RPAC2